MTEYALILDGAELRRADFEDQPPALAPNKGKWVPVVSEQRPDFDPLVKAADLVVTITDDAVVDGWKLRPCTPEERTAVLASINAETLASIAELEASIDTPRFRRDMMADPSRIYDPATGQTVAEKLAEVDSHIAVLRGKLVR